MVSLTSLRAFPHLRVGTFIEAPEPLRTKTYRENFPTFGWGLSLRLQYLVPGFHILRFPHLRVGTFIEAEDKHWGRVLGIHFPTFGWGLSLRLLRRVPHNLP